MIFSYYPGCTLKNKAQDLDRYARRSAEALGITLSELDEWQCCGGAYPMAANETGVRLSSVRALMAARERGQALVTLCSACHNVIKQTNYDIVRDATFSERANNYMAPEEYHGETQVYHYLELLRDVVGFEELSKKVKNPLTGKKVGAYYGCLLLRPSKALQMDNPENPKIMEDFLRAIGAEPVVYPYRNECCGGYVTLEDRALAAKKSGNVLASAADMGAELLVTACPLCLYNLTKTTSADQKLPVLYFTELLAEALGVKD